jgi:hypothetical protein
MKLLKRIAGPTPLRWKKIMLSVAAIGAGLGSVVSNIPSSWINPETKIFLMEIIGFVVTVITFFAQTRVEPDKEEL